MSDLAYVPLLPWTCSQCLHGGRRGQWAIRPGCPAQDSAGTFREKKPKGYPRGDGTPVSLGAKPCE